jgi:hypothetical protein
MVPILRMIVTLSAAFFAGGAVYVSLVEHPARMANIRLALDEFRLSYPRAAPWQASTAIICFLAAALLSVLTRDWLWAVGGLVVGSVVPLTLVVIMPTNKRLLYDAGPLEPDEAASLLKHWGWLHWLRSILGTLGLLLLLTHSLAFFS